MVILVNIPFIMLGTGYIFCPCCPAHDIMCYEVYFTELAEVSIYWRRAEQSFQHSEPHLQMGNP